MSLINNTKYAILDNGEVLANKYQITIGEGTNTTFLFIKQDGMLISGVELTGVVPFIDNGKCIFASETFYFEFSSNNVSEFINEITTITAQVILDEFLGYFGAI